MGTTSSRELPIDGFLDDADDFRLLIKTFDEGVDVGRAKVLSECDQAFRR